MIRDCPSMNVTSAWHIQNADICFELVAARLLQALEQKVLRSIARRGDGPGHPIRKAKSVSRPISSAKF